MAVGDEALSGAIKLHREGYALRARLFGYNQDLKQHISREFKVEEGLLRGGSAWGEEKSAAAI